MYHIYDLVKNISHTHNITNQFSVKCIPFFLIFNPALMCVSSGLYGLQGQIALLPTFFITYFVLHKNMNTANSNSIFILGEHPFQYYLCKFYIGITLQNIAHCVLEGCVRQLGLVEQFVSNPTHPMQHAKSYNLTTFNLSSNTHGYCISTPYLQQHSF